MSTLTVTITDGLLELLRERGWRVGSTAEQVLQRGVELWTQQPDSEVFEEAVEHVLRKNRELYQRLA